MIVEPIGLSIQNAADNILPAETTKVHGSLYQTGMFHEESYSVGPSEVMFIGGKSFENITPTTATLADRKIVIVGPSGVSV